jgi:hypothetical protein
MMENYPEGTIFIEVRGIYDGCSVAQLPGGTLVNMWPITDRRYSPTQQWIESNTPTEKG